MDIGMPVMNGLECTKIITESFPEIKVVIYSVIENIEVMRGAYRAGVSGYIKKDTPMEELFDAIEKIYSDEKNILSGEDL
jgi:DNA-binding NarL/FixJ family response regulator